MTDRLTLEPALLPELDRQLERAAGAANTHSGSAARLAGWAAATHPSLGQAAASLRQAQGALSDTSSRLTGVRTDLGARANLLGVEAWPAALPAACPTRLPGEWGKKNDVVGRTPEQALARGDGKQDDMITDLWQMPWYGFVGIRDSAWQWGYGMLHADIGQPGDTEVRPGSSIDLFSQNTKFGLVDPSNARWGAAGDTQVAALTWVMGHNRAGITEIEGSGLGAEAEATVGKDGAGLGAQASLGEAAVTAGPLSSKRADDVQARVGVSYGGGAAARLHWSDDDGDGVREYGFGIDYGPLSMDLKSERMDPYVELAKHLLS
ncbi:MAG TPA: hypothetical protein VGJ60_08730 [Chloroflexota bacterium]|jgi:hypothetical protein